MRARTILAIVVAIAAVPVLFYAAVFAILFARPMYDDYANRVPFDETAWRASDSSERVRMVDDLLATHDFHGKTRAEVTALLGEPPASEYFAGWDMQYFLGPERGPFSIDSEWLVFRLDADSRVVEYRVQAD